MRAAKIGILLAAVALQPASLPVAQEIVPGAACGVMTVQITAQEVIDCLRYLRLMAVPPTRYSPTRYTIDQLVTDIDDNIRPFLFGGMFQVRDADDVPTPTEDIITENAAAPGGRCKEELFEPRPVARIADTYQFACFVRADFPLLRGIAAEITTVEIMGYIQDHILPNLFGGIVTIRADNAIRNIPPDIPQYADTLKECPNMFIAFPVARYLEIVPNAPATQSACLSTLVFMPYSSRLAVGSIPDLAEFIDREIRPFLFGGIMTIGVGHVGPPPVPQFPSTLASCPSGFRPWPIAFFRRPDLSPDFLEITQYACIHAG